MSTKNSIPSWKRYFEDRGIDKSLSLRYLEYIKKLNKNNVPVIFEFEHLTMLLGLQHKFLAAMINSPSSFYRAFVIPKRRGGFRKIDAPYPSLLFAQKWIYKNILNEVEISENAYGFAKKRSIIDNAKMHVGSKAFLKVDLKDFFPSIGINLVIQVFRSLGYAKNVSYYLASLCCLDDALVQGAATSPCLSNIICHHLDNRLNSLANTYNATYTRYADDIAFSGDYIPHDLINTINEIIEDCGFHLNKEKTFLSHKTGKRILTGISISGDKLKLPRDLKREIRKQAHFVIKYGYLSHAAKKKIRNPFFLESLYGKLQFWVQVEPSCEVAKLYCREISLIINSMSAED